MTVGEYLTSAFKKNDEQNVSDFKNLIMDYDFEVVPISWDIAEEAARIRSKYTTIKMMDALQLAAAKIEGCDAFVSNDLQLRQYSDVTVIILEEKDVS